MSLPNLPTPNGSGYTFARVQPLASMQTSPSLFARPSRQAALERLDAFCEKAENYAAERNSDCGSLDADGVSGLSPYLTTRMLTEREVLERVLRQHAFSTVSKFVDEICWRAYWKGFLEMRPSLWTDYLDELATEHNRLAQENPLERDYASATSGQTGIDCFDHWVQELITTGWLHNHTRMWFASIWIFTLKLPWTLGADFFLRHLLDGDAASNTLSWRWVAGLHTPGKHYVARASNIEKFTEGRFSPFGQLNESPEPLTENRERPAPRKLYFLSAPSASVLEGPVGLLLHSEDLSPENGPFAQHPVNAIAGGMPDSLVAGLLLDQKPYTFRQTAIGKTLERASHHFDCPSEPLNGHNYIEHLCDWALSNKLKHVLISEVAVGPWVPVFEAAAQALGDYRVQLHFAHRRWDTAFWPHATAGFFKLKKEVPRTLAKLGIV